MFRHDRSRRCWTLRPKFLVGARLLRYETMEGRLVLSAAGFAGNECAPELNDDGLDVIVPDESFSPDSEIAFQFSAAEVVSDAGVGATAASDIRLILDPDMGTRPNGATPEGATLRLNDQGTTEVTDDLWEFSWTPDATQVGTFRLFMIATDDGGTGNVPLSDVYTFNITVDNRATIDLNGDNDDGIDFGPVDFTESDSSTPVSIVDSDLSIPFASSGMISSATVQIVDPQADGLELLGITAGAALDIDDSTAGQLVITVNGGGLADKSLFEEALRTLTYNNTSDDPASTRIVNFTVNDGSAESDVAATTIQVLATNDRPALLVNENLPDALVGVDVILPLIATDPESGDLLTFRLVRGPAGAVISPLQTGGSDTTPQISPDPDGFYRAEIHWTPTEEQGRAGSVEFLVEATDTGSLADAEVYGIAIENQAPVASDDPIAVSADAGATAVGDILANDSDSDGDTFTADSVTAGGSTFDVGTEFTHPVSGARIQVAANGQIDYDPAGQFEFLGVGQTTTDTLSYTIIDQALNSSTAAVVTITVAGVNEAPTAGNVGGDAVEDGPAVVIGFDGDDVDDGEASSLTYDIAAQPTQGGSVGNNHDGTFSFDPGDDFQDLAEGITRDATFNYTATDAQTAVSDEAIAAITVTGVNDAPRFDLDNVDGLASTLPTGDSQSDSVITLQLDLSSTEANVNSLDQVDIPSFTEDVDGESLTYDLFLDDAGGTPFRVDNLPRLNDSNQLVWVPTAEDVGDNYVIRVRAEDNPSNGNAKRKSFDIVISVATGNPSVVSVSGVDVSAVDSEVMILFSKAMGSAAFESANYALTTIDGGILSDRAVTIDDAVADGDRKVVLQLDETDIGNFSVGGVAQLRLTIDSQVMDAEGNAIEGDLVFTIDLLSPQA